MIKFLIWRKETYSLIKLMPNNLIISYSKKTGKSVAELEDSWNSAEKIVKKDYPNIKEGDDSYYKLIVSIFKNMVGVKEESISLKDMYDLNKNNVK